MWLSDTSVKRPVLAAVANLLIVVFGILSFVKLPLREYPDIDPPIVSIQTTYEGAAANVVESRITKIIEERIAGVEGIKSIDSKSVDGHSNIEVEFYINRNINDAVGDIRDRISGLLGTLPKDASVPEIEKTSADEDVIMWLHLVGDGMSIMDLTEYVRLYIKDNFSALDGVSRARIGGAFDKSMRIWLKPHELAARNLTVEDVEKALRNENIELPAGEIESSNIDFTVRVIRGYRTEEDFKNLTLARGKDGYVVKLSDVAKVEIAPQELRNTLRSNGEHMVAIGIVKQSKANTLDVANAVRKEMARVNKQLPPNMKLNMAYDSSIFVDSAVKEVYHTLVIAVILVVLVIFAFLGNARAMVIPALTVPISLIGTFIVLFIFGYSINLLTLLALILAIGLVVDDAIVVVENIHSRMELGEPRLLASYRGTRQVGFAVVATTLVLVAVFLPFMFLEDDIGRLFGEFAVAMSAAILFSGFAALTITPMLSSKLLQKSENSNKFTIIVDEKFEKLKNAYLNKLQFAIDKPYYSIACLVAMLLISAVLIKVIPSEFAPKEDRGYLRINMRGPEGASYNYTLEHVEELEKRMQPFIESSEFERVMMRIPASFSKSSSFNNARGSVVLSDWSSGRKPIFYYIKKIRELSSDMSGVKVSAVLKKSFGSSDAKPVQFVIGGPTYEDLAVWRDIILDKASKNPGLFELDSDYLETKPQLGIVVNQDAASTLGVEMAEINGALATLLGGKKVTTFEDQGQEYDVVLESEKKFKTTIKDIGNIYVRSARTGLLIPLASLISTEEFSDAAALKRYNKVRSITIEANLSSDYSLGEALEYLRSLVIKELPKGATIDYKGDSLDYIETSNSVYFIFLLSIVIVFLMLAAQFESIVHPFVIIFTVPLAVTGALVALWLGSQTLNIYSQIGLIILVGISTKNGILIVEFTNQLRDEGIEFTKALVSASARRLRPIIMTTLTAAMGAIPLVFASGAGSESRVAIGVVIFWGIIVATFFTVFIIPVIYSLLARNTNSSHSIQVELLGQEKKFK